MWLVVALLPGSLPSGVAPLSSSAGDFLGGRDAWFPVAPSLPRPRAPGTMMLRPLISDLLIILWRVDK